MVIAVTCVLAYLHLRLSVGYDLYGKQIVIGFYTLEISWLLCHKARSKVRKSPGCYATRLALQLGNPLVAAPQALIHN